MKTVRLTMAQALVRYLTAQRTVIDRREVPLFAGVFAIFGHGNVTCLGEALEPVQQVEHFGNPTTTVNDAFKAVTRYWDRISRPEQIISSLPQAVAMMLDPGDCGPVFLALAQDAQAEAYDYPVEFFETKLHRVPRP